MNASAIRLFVRRRKVALKARLSSSLNVNVGAGETCFPGWINLDKELLDITVQRDWARIFSTQSIDRLLTEHVLEHLEDSEIRSFLKTVKAFMAPGGRIRIAVPDGFHPDPNYIEQVRPGGSGAGADDHKQLFNYRSLTDQLEAAGYSVCLLEWFNEGGEFNQENWSHEDGPVLRSADTDKRNIAQPLSYTSLIVDGLLA